MASDHFVWGCAQPARLKDPFRSWATALRASCGMVVLAVSFCGQAYAAESCDRRDLKDGEIAIAKSWGEKLVAALPKVDSARWRPTGTARTGNYVLATFSLGSGGADGGADSDQKCYGKVTEGRPFCDFHATGCMPTVNVYRQLFTADFQPAQDALMKHGSTVATSTTPKASERLQKCMKLLETNSKEGIACMEAAAQANKAEMKASQQAHAPLQRRLEENRLEVSADLYADSGCGDANVSAGTGDQRPGVFLKERSDGDALMQRWCFHSTRSPVAPDTGPTSAAPNLAKVRSVRVAIKGAPADFVRALSKQIDEAALTALVNQ
jgi:hypothetical protein